MNDEPSMIGPNWRGEFDERQLKEIEFSRLYEMDFRHGTDGHNAKLIIAKMTTLLDTYVAQIKELRGE